MLSILVIGDTHIPDRAQKINPKLLEFIEHGKPWDTVLFTGDLTGLEVLNWVKTLGKKVICVRGNMDTIPLPKTARVEIASYTIGLHHGDGVYPRGDPYGLAKIAESLKVNILISGHTHAPFVKLSPDKSVLLLNPGSLTGVWGGGGGSMKPSLMLLNLDEVVEVELYTLDNDNLLKTKISVSRKENSWLI